MKREFYFKLIIDWEDNDNVCNELLIEDSGIYDELKDGVSIELIEVYESKQAD